MWVTNVVRVLPAQGVQAFSLPADAPEQAMRPEGMGLLLFTQPQDLAARVKDDKDASDGSMAGGP